MQSINIFRVVAILLDVKKNSLWPFSGTLWGFFVVAAVVVVVVVVLFLEQF